MNILQHIEINDNSRKPKYLQIIDGITDHISKGHFNIEDKMPSINMLSEAFDLSRDTVEKAYNILKERKIIVSVKGKGHYIAKTKLISKINVLFLVNKLSSYKMQIYNSFNNHIGPNTFTDIQIYHCNKSLFLDLLEKHNGAYDYYIIMTHFKSESDTHISTLKEVTQAINTIPKDKLIMLDNLKYGLDQKIINIYQDFENDLYNALQNGYNKINNYNKIVLVYPEKHIYPYPKGVVRGFKKFCIKKSFPFEIIDEVYPDIVLKKGDLFITIRETDLVNLIHRIQEDEYKMGQDIGIISYNDTPLKDLLGISVITTDFVKMGETAAQMILDNKKGNVQNPFHFIDRNSM